MNKVSVEIEIERIEYALQDLKFLGDHLKDPVYKNSIFSSVRDLEKSLGNIKAELEGDDNA